MRLTLYRFSCMPSSSCWCILTITGICSDDNVYITCCLLQRHTLPRSTCVPFSRLAEHAHTHITCVVDNTHAVCNCMLTRLTLSRSSCMPSNRLAVRPCTNMQLQLTTYAVDAVHMKLRCMSMRHTLSRSSCMPSSRLAVQASSLSSFPCSPCSLPRCSSSSATLQTYKGSYLSVRRNIGCNEDNQVHLALLQLQFCHPADMQQFRT